MEMKRHEESLNLQSFFCRNVELFVAQELLIFCQKWWLAANFFINDLKQFVLNAVVVGVVCCVDSTRKKWVVLNMFKSGYFSLVRNLTG